jgi:hypothetical protein
MLHTRHRHTPSNCRSCTLIDPCETHENNKPIHMKKSKRSCPLPFLAATRAEPLAMLLRRPFVARPLRFFIGGSRFIILSTA